MYFKSLKFSISGKLGVLVLLNLSLVVFSFSQYPYNFDIVVQPNADEVGVFPFNGLGQWSGCSYTKPRKLRVVEERYSPYGRQYATFDGGKRIGGSYIADNGRGTCNGLNGYATSKYLYPDLSAFPTQMSDTITIQLTSLVPVKVDRISLQTDISQEYEITLYNSAGSPVTKNYTSPSQNYSSHRYLINRVLLSDLGFSNNEMGDVVKITVKSLNPEWAFALHGVYYNVFNDDGGGGSPEPPDRENINPVIFVPGVAGSELVENEAGTIKERWLPESLEDARESISTLNLPSNKDIYATDVLWGQKYIGDRYEAKFYADILQFLSGEDISGTQYPEKVIGKLYDVDNKPERRTLTGCDKNNQDSDDPELKPRVFVFAYDWRQDNVYTASLLKDYVRCVKEIYPDKKINIVAHSMGGLVTRRYLLDNPTNNEIEKVVTIGTPWLGAAKGLHALETGAFIAPAFEIETWEERGAWAANVAIAGKLKSAMETFSGPLQLLPSQQYFNLNMADSSTETFPSPLSVKSYPWSSRENYDYSDMRSWLDSRYSIMPGSITNKFHEVDHGILQDDWRQDSSNVEYHHIYAQQRSNKTIGRVNATERTICNNVSLNCFKFGLFEPIPTNGDGTVPTISGRRVSLFDNLNSDRAKRYFHDAKLDSNLSNDNTDHTKMTEHENVLNRLRQILTGTEQGTMVPEDTDYSTSPDSFRKGLTNEDQSFYISLNNVDGFQFSQGQFGSFVEASGFNNSQVVPIGERGVWVAAPAKDTYKLSFLEMANQSV